MTERAAIYSRVSTKEQADSGTSLSTQEQRAREYAERMGYRIVDALTVSEDHRGTELSRPGLTHLKDAASSSLFDILLICTFDRLHRPKNQGDEWQALEVMAYFRDRGVTVEFVDGSIPTDGAYGSLFSILEGLKAGDERRKLIERTQRGRNAKKAESEWVFG